MTRTPAIIAIVAVITIAATASAIPSPYPPFGGTGDAFNVARYARVQDGTVRGRVTIGTPRAQCAGPGDTWSNANGRGICLRVWTPFSYVRIMNQRPKIVM